MSDSWRYQKSNGFKNAAFELKIEMFSNDEEGLSAIMDQIFALVHKAHLAVIPNPIDSRCKGCGQ